MSDPTIFTGLQFFEGGELATYEWDTLYLAGERWPGICEVTGAGVSRRVDAKATKGSDGAVLKDQGMNLAKMTIKVMVYNRTDWAELQRLLPTVHPRRPGGARTPTSIVTPYTKLLGIENIYITSIPIPSLDKSKQQLTLTMQAIEWVPQPKPVKHAAGGGSSSTVDWDKLANAANQVGEAAADAWDGSAGESAVNGIKDIGGSEVDNFLDNIGL